MDRVLTGFACAFGSCGFALAVVALNPPAALGLGMLDALMFAIWTSLMAVLFAVLARIAQFRALRRLRAETRWLRHHRHHSDGTEVWFGK